MTDRTSEIAEAQRLARRAAQLGTDDALALCTAGIALGYVAGELEEGLALTERALALNPNLAWAWLFNASIKVWLGEPEVALERVARAMRLSPQDPQMFNIQTATACAHFVAGRYADALSWAETAVRGHPIYLLSTSVAAASGALAGRQAEAERATARLLQLQPALRIADLSDLFPVRQAADVARWEEGLRHAGLPD